MTGKTLKYFLLLTAVSVSAGLFSLCTSLTGDNGILSRDGTKPDSDIKPSFAANSAAISIIALEPAPEDTVRISVSNPVSGMSFEADTTWLVTSYSGGILIVSIRESMARDVPDTSVEKIIRMKIGPDKIDSCIVTATIGHFVFLPDSLSLSFIAGFNTATDTLPVAIRHEITGAAVASPDPWIGWNRAQGSVSVFVKSSAVPLADTTLRGILVLLSGTRPADTLSVTAAIVGMVDSGMKLIPAGGTAFAMGSSLDIDSAAPVHPVSFTRSFWMDSTEVTLAQYVAVLHKNPTTNTTYPQWPIYNVTWFDAVLYCNARSRLKGLDTAYSYTSITGSAGSGCTALGNLAVDYQSGGYRLPTEAEWEFAVRGGTTTRFYWGDSLDLSFCRFGASSVANVAQFKPNAYGLYDMSGNVSEWCNDLYAPYPLSTAPVVDPVTAVPVSAGLACVRGGCYNDFEVSLRSAHRLGFLTNLSDANNGFRTVRRAGK